MVVKLASKINTVTDDIWIHHCHFHHYHHHNHKSLILFIWGLHELYFPHTLFSTSFLVTPQPIWMTSQLWTQKVSIAFSTCDRTMGFTYVNVTCVNGMYAMFTHVKYIAMFFRITIFTWDKWVLDPIVLDVLQFFRYFYKFLKIHEELRCEVKHLDVSNNIRIFNT